MITQNIAKNRLPVNILSNYVAIAIIALIGFFITPYLIKHLGTELYGVVPLFVSIVNYFRLLTTSISSSVTRFVSVSVGDSSNKANIYYSTSFFALAMLAVIIMLVVLAASCWLESIFNIPVGSEAGASYLFVLIMASSLIGAMSSTFKVSTFIKHRFDLDNFVKVLGWACHLTVIYILFNILDPELESVGAAYLAMSLVLFLGALFIAKYLTPELGVSLKLFKWDAFREMASMSAWGAIDELGTLFLFSIDLVIVNLFLGSEAVGRYAPVVQWSMLMSILGGTISGTFTPIVYQYVAEKNYKELVAQTCRAMKYMGLFMAFPVGIICGFSSPLLEVWLGDSFKNLSPIMFILVFPQVLYLSIAPLYAVNRGVGKVKVPAVVTFFSGVTNLLLSIALVKYTNLGILGVALSTTICLSVRNGLFSPLYSSIIFKQPLLFFIKSVFPGIILATLLAMVCFMTAKFVEISSFMGLAGISLSVFLSFIPILFFFFLTRQDKEFFLSFLHKINVTHLKKNL